jgi:protein TonB
VTGFRLTIGTDGKVSDCQVTKSSGSAELDKTTCDLMRRRALCSGHGR